MQVPGNYTNVWGYFITIGWRDKDAATLRFNNTVLYTSTSSPELVTFRIYLFDVGDK